MYLYKTKREKHIEKPRTRSPNMPKKKEYEAPGEGLSDLERRVYRGLRKAGWRVEDIQSQVNMRGGRSRLGGQVIDFYLIPLNLPIMVNGEYWHKSGDEQIQAEAEITEEFGKPPVVIWGDEAEDDEEAYATILRKIGRAGS